MEMETDLLTRLSALNVDTAGALIRFSSSRALYEKYLLRFPADESFPAYLAAVQAEDPEQMYACAHSLKGVTGNLGLTPLYSIFYDIVVLLRAKDYDAVYALTDKLKQVHDQIVQAIEPTIAVDENPALAEPTEEKKEQHYV